ncbi:MAG: hypothetical protein ABI361_09365 [Nitrososphaera sp.]|jgi:hypothetical protein
MATEKPKTYTVTLELPAWLHKTFAVAAVAFDKSQAEMLVHELADYAEVCYIHSNRLGDWFKTLQEKETGA